MQIFIKLLANYRNYLPESTKGNQISMDVPEDIRIEKVLDFFPIPPVPESVVLINGRTMVPGESLKEGDVICAFSAMAGG
jgi:sulfur carrier protein ThiS